MDVKEELINEVVSVTASLGPEGELTPTQFSWRDRNYPVVGVGRQWADEAGRHVLIETVGSDRFELELSRSDLLWRVVRAWRTPFMA